MVRLTQEWAAASPTDHMLAMMPVALRDRELLSHFCMLMAVEADRLMQICNAQAGSTKRCKHEAERHANKMLVRVEKLSDFTKLSTKNWVRRNLRM